MKKIIYLLSIAIVLVACETMEDTYSEYNTPKERYVGKVSDVKIELGWERFRLSWTNSVDAAITNIKIKWENESNETDSVLLPAGTEVYETESIFSNQNYKFTVTAIDNRNKESFPVEVYATPFTEHSTKVEMLKVVEKKFFFVDDQLILLFYEAGKDMYDAELSYTSMGEQKTLKIEPADFERGRLVVEGIDAGSDVTIKGMMKIIECIDEIALDPYVLDRTKKSWSGAFISNMRLQFDMLDVLEEHLDTVTTLYVDYNVTSIEDILYLPKLQKVVLGKKRMNVSSSNLSNSSYVSKFEDVDASVFALRKMRELKGIEVDIYGKQFQINDSLNFETWYSSNTPPKISIPDDVGDWEISYNNYADYYENDPEWLNHNYFLEDIMGSSRIWESKASSEITIHEIVYDMGELKEVKGFQFYQSTQSTSKYYLPSNIEIYVSDDDINWESAYFQGGLNVGGVIGEVTIEKMREPKTIQYIKLIVKDVDLGNKKIVAIGDFLPLI